MTYRIQIFARIDNDEEPTLLGEVDVTGHTDDYLDELPEALRAIAFGVEEQTLQAERALREMLGAKKAARRSERIYDDRGTD